MMDPDLPKPYPFKEPVLLYPEGVWLDLPSKHQEMIFVQEGRLVIEDLILLPQERVTERMSQWMVHGRRPSRVEQRLLLEEDSSGKITCDCAQMGPLEIAQAYSQGLRSFYEDRTLFTSLPTDMGHWTYVNALFDGHGALGGGSEVAELLSHHLGVQRLVEAMHSWSYRLHKPWQAMNDAEIESGWSFNLLQLQRLIRELCLQREMETKRVQQTQQTLTHIKAMLNAIIEEGGISPEKGYHASNACNQIEEILAHRSLQGIGTTALYLFWKIHPASDRIDLFFASVGDSNAALITNTPYHYEFFEEATAANPSFHQEILRRGGRLVPSVGGGWRLNGRWLPCRSIGDLFLILSEEGLACVQPKGMSPRPWVSKLTLCPNPTTQGEIAYDQAEAVMLYSDGLKEGSGNGAVGMLSYLSAMLQAQISLKAAAEAVVAQALQGGSTDNCTVQLIDLRPLANRSSREQLYHTLHNLHTPLGCFDSF